MQKLTEFFKENKISVVENEPMCKHTSFKIGGPSKYFAVVETEAQLASFLKFAKTEKVPYKIIGNGSNLLFSDEGFGGVVLRLQGDFLNVSCDGETVSCGAGASLKSVCDYAESQSLAGMEFAYGIPGTIGGAVFMNAGAYGGEMKDIVLSACALDSDGNEHCFSGKDLDFRYRHSVFADKKLYVTKIKIGLKKGERNEIKGKMKELMGRRKEKQPLEFPSAGSTFKRPEGYFAAALIDECSLKGLRVGGAEVSEKHAGFVINKGGATAEDVLELIEKIKEEVKRQKGVCLDCELETVKEEL